MLDLLEDDDAVSGAFVRCRWSFVGENSFDAIGEGIVFSDDRAIRCLDGIFQCLVGNGDGLYSSVLDCEFVTQGVLMYDDAGIRAEVDGDIRNRFQSWTQISACTDRRIRLLIEYEILGDIGIEFADGEILYQEQILDDVIDFRLVLEIYAFDEQHIVLVFHDDMRLDGLILVRREEFEIADDIDGRIGDALLVYGQIGDAL